MKIFMDTSVLIKRYFSEAGSRKVDELFESASQIVVSPVTGIESRSILRRLLAEKKITQAEYKKLNDELTFDFDYFTVISFDNAIELMAKKLVDKYQLKTLDAIQLAAALSKKIHVSYFIASDKKLLNAAKKENLHIINPTVEE